MALTSTALALSKSLAQPDGPIVRRSQIQTLVQAKNYALAAAWVTIGLISRHGVQPELEAALTQYQRAAWIADSFLSTQSDLPGVLAILVAADGLIEQAAARLNGTTATTSSSPTTTTTSGGNVVPIRGPGTVIYGAPPVKRAGVNWWLLGGIAITGALLMAGSRKGGGKHASLRP